MGRFFFLNIFLGVVGGGGGRGGEGRGGDGEWEGKKGGEGERG